MSDVRKDPAQGYADDGSGQIQGHLVQHQSPDELLQDQLANLLFRSEDGEIGSEALDALLDRLDEVSPLPRTLDPEASLRQFHQQYAPVFHTVRPPKAPKQSVSVPKRRPILSITKVFAIAVALILLLCTTAQALGFDVFSAIVHWTSELLSLDRQSVSFASVRYNPLELGKMAAFDTPDEAMSVFGIEAPLVPKDIPDRFELVSVTADNISTGICIHVDYVCEDGFLQLEYKETPMQDYAAIEMEYGDMAPYVAKEIKHYLTSDLDRWKAVWENGDFECCLHGTISEQELKNMIDSIY